MLPPLRSLLPTAVLAVILTAGGCRTHRSEVSHTGKSIVVTDASLDTGGSDTLRFGHLRQGETARQRVWLHNASSRNLAVVSHRVSCGCTTPEYGNQPFTPSNDLQLTVSFDTRGLYGWQMKLLELRFAGGGAPLKIYLEAEVE